MAPGGVLFTKEVRVTSHKSELCSHFKKSHACPLWTMHGQIIVCVRDPSAADSQVTTAVLTELFIFSTAHGNVEIYITVCTCFVKSFFCPLSLHSQFALSPATPKGTNVGAVDVFKGSLQFFCQNGQVLIAVLMNGQIRTQEATTYHAQFGNPPQSPISFCGRRTSGDVGMLSEHCSVI